MTLLPYITVIECAWIAHCQQPCGNMLSPIAAICPTTYYQTPCPLSTTTFTIDLHNNEWRHFVGMIRPHVPTRSLIILISGPEAACFLGTKSQVNLPKLQFQKTYFHEWCAHGDFDNLYHWIRSSMYPSIDKSLTAVPDLKCIWGALVAALVVILGGRWRGWCYQDDIAMTCWGISWGEGRHHCCGLDDIWCNRYIRDGSVLEVHVSGLGGGKHCDATWSAAFWFCRTNIASSAEHNHKERVL
jgi:hypothetical protein